MKIQENAIWFHDKRWPYGAYAESTFCTHLHSEWLPDVLYNTYWIMGPITLISCNYIWSWCERAIVWSAYGYVHGPQSSQDFHAGCEIQWSPVITMSAIVKYCLLRSQICIPNHYQTISMLTGYIDSLDIYI